MMEEGVVGRVLTGEDPTDKGLREGAGLVSSMADMRSKVVKQYFIWFAHLLKHVPENFFDLTPLE